MGWIVHDAIIVTSWDWELIDRAHTLAKQNMPYVSDVVTSPINRYRSFFIAPDGSKEGWAESDHGDAMRAAFLKWIDAQAYDDGSSCIDCVAVRYGELEPEIRPRAALSKAGADNE